MIIVGIFQWNYKILRTARNLQKTHMIIFYKEAVEHCVMGNNLNPIKLIALGVERTRNHAVESSKKSLLKKPANSLESVGPYAFICTKTLF